MPIENFVGTKTVGFNRMNFLLDSLRDLDEQLKEASNGRGTLYTFKGSPVQVFRRINDKIPIEKICFEQDCEPIWNKRDNLVRDMCEELQIECIERISHTLWDPHVIIETNGGIPPLTYQMFLVSIK